MSLQAQLTKMPNLTHKRGARILTLDIERMKGQFAAEFWDLNDYKGRRIHPDNVVEWPRTICAAWKWYGQARVEFAAEWEPAGPVAMFRRIWAAYDDAEIVVGHNIAGFDTKHLNTAWRDLGLPPPSPYKTVDTLQVARRQFGDESRTLDALCRRLGIAAKTDKYDVEVARAACAGDRTAQRKLAAYNKGDIRATEALYDRLRGWIPNHPHHRAGHAQLVCNQCWGINLTPQDRDRLAQSYTYPLFRCDDCGANVTDTRSSGRVANTRGAS